MEIIGLNQILKEDIYQSQMINRQNGLLFNTFNYEVKKLLPLNKNYKVIGIMKDELNGVIMEKFIISCPKQILYKKEYNEHEKMATK